MNLTIYPFMMRALSAVLLLAAVGCQTAPDTGAAKAGTAETKTADYSNRRITGRKNMQLAPGVFIHSDRIVVRSGDGATAFEGRVFLDGHANADGGTGLGAWPKYAYSNSALWNAQTKSLKMTGSPVVETDKLVQVAKSADTYIILNGQTWISDGPTRTIVRGETGKPAP